ncbi:hypothetical protein [Chryseobacterium daeguense]|uniref:hypothetical protein n=1 Tax=Chryseobacterium daeguense TaxID=412438 RepID=UPI000418E927|nr:hypothetical protein [Chryseobacterium daeguense]
MKKLLLICFLCSFFWGIAQEKKISFEKEIDYKLTDKNKTDVFIKTFAGKNSEFLTKINIKNLPMYFFTDAIGTSAVSLDMNNRLDGGNALISSMYFGLNAYAFEQDKQEFILESKKLNTKETILGIPCSHYLINFKEKSDGQTDKESFKVCIDDKSNYNNLPVLTGLIRFFDRRSGFKNSDLKGLILKGGPEKTYDTEYFVASSIKDSKDFVFFDHRKTMMDQQRQQDSIVLAHQKQEAEYAAMDSTAAVADSAAYPLDDEYYIPDYVSEYREKSIADGGLTISNIPSKSLWKGLPKHCQNFEKEMPSFNNKDLKSHLKNYVGQMCDMYLTQTSYHSVGIKITLDEIRREVLYLNEIQEKLDTADKKKLTTYLKNLD